MSPSRDPKILGTDNMIWYGEPIYCLNHYGAWLDQNNATYNHYILPMIIAPCLLLSLADNQRCPLHVDSQGSLLVYDSVLTSFCSHAIHLNKLSRSRSPSRHNPLGPWLVSFSKQDKQESFPSCFPIKLGHRADFLRPKNIYRLVEYSP